MRTVHLAIVMTTTESSSNIASAVHHDQWEKPVSKAEFDRAREKHDIFTMIAMVSARELCTLKLLVFILTSSTASLNLSITLLRGVTVFSISKS